LGAVGDRVSLADGNGPVAVTAAEFTALSGNFA
jgi:hypothetical protein